MFSLLFDYIHFIINIIIKVFLLACSLLAIMNTMTKKIAIFLPPLQSVSGGFAVLMHLGHHLGHANCDVSFVVIKSDVPPASYTHALPQVQIPVVDIDSIELGPDYAWIVPEGWINALVAGLKAKAHCIVYAQNWAFGLTPLPGDTCWDQLDVDFLYVSEPVRLCLQSMTGKNGHILRPGIDRKLFTNNKLISDEQAVEGPIRIAWMPRKNKAFGSLIQHAIRERFHRLHPQIKIEWVSIQKLSLEDVAKTLRTCHIFLATGFPEGCPLPPLEAMASGCIVVGFAGLGGWDYMRQARFINDEHMPFLYEPWFDLRETPFGGNGLYVPDADVFGATLALEQVCLLLKAGGQRLATLRKNIADTANYYDIDRQAENIIELIPHLIAKN